VLEADEPHFTCTRCFSSSFYILTRSSFTALSSLSNHSRPPIANARVRNRTRYSTKAVHRAQVVSGTLAADTDALTGESNETLSAQRKLITLEEQRSSAWTEKTLAGIAGELLRSRVMRLLCVCAK
jgi:hypothetical protein